MPPLELRWLAWMEAPIPRSLRVAGIPACALLLTSLFLFLGFPYAELAERVTHQLGTASGMRVDLGAIQPRITIGGPGLRMDRVDLNADGERLFRIDVLAIRPAWSFSWFRARPALWIDLESSVGALAGTLVIGDEPRWSGSLREVDLASLPLPSQATSSLSGTLSADADLRRVEGELRGEIRFEASDGSLSHSSMPLDLPFDSLRGQLRIEDAPHWLSIESLSIDGPVIAAEISGRVERRAQDRPLDIEAAIEIRSPPFRSLLQGMGVELDASGRASLHLVGTLENPEFRPR